MRDTAARVICTFGTLGTLETCAFATCAFATYAFATCDGAFRHEPVGSRKARGAEKASLRSTALYRRGLASRMGMAIPG
jgi:hypothetical protein